MRRGVDVGGLFFVEATICDGSGEVSSLTQTQTGYFYKVSVENGTTIKRDVTLENTIAHGASYFGFLPTGSPPATASWTPTLPGILTTADDQCDLELTKRVTAAFNAKS
jgi:hypothetical protein